MSLKRSQQGLDWLNFFVADVQTGFGPFIAVYLTAQAWTSGQIGIVLSIGTISAMLSQVPAGAAVDALRHKTRAAAVAIGAISASALILAIWPQRAPVAIAEVLHGFASCMVGPAIAAISLIVAASGHTPLGERLGRNARFASLGNAIAAALMGAFGTYISERAVFYLTAALSVPALFALSMIRAQRAEPGAGSPGADRSGPRRAEPVWRVLLGRRLLIFAACVALFHLSNAAMLPLVAGELTKHAGRSASLIIAAAIVVPQVLVAILSPGVGRAADRWGRRPVLILGFCALPLRALLFAISNDAVAVVAIQVLDGVGGAVFGVMLPLVVADLTEGTGRFNVSLGAMGVAVGLGATLSTTIAGAVADEAGLGAAFLLLAGAGALAVAVAAFMLPETRRT